MGGERTRVRRQHYVVKFTFAAAAELVTPAIRDFAGNDLVNELTGASLGAEGER